MCNCSFIYFYVDLIEDGIGDYVEAYVISGRIGWWETYNLKRDIHLYYQNIIYLSNIEVGQRSLDACREN